METYSIKCKCRNCGKEFTENIPKGTEVVEWLGKLTWRSSVPNFIKCPICETTSITKELN